VAWSASITVLPVTWIVLAVTFSRAQCLCGGVGGREMLIGDAADDLCDFTSSGQG